MQFESFNNDLNVAGDWCTDIKSYLEIPTKKVPFRVKAQSLNYVLIENELSRKNYDGLFLRCPSFPQTMEILKHIHEGVCAAYQAERKIRWLIHKHSYFWPLILKDYITYAKGCQQC